MCLIRLVAGTHTDHIHEHEQIGYILKGTVIISIGSSQRTLGPGEGYRMPPGERHAFVAGADSDLEYIEVFSPPRTENDL